ncbi:hypothetical protein [Tenacibaculum sp. SDUM215027]|uniref:hypothetical protein n=1 Tax=Tenacibaculum sp. SDUM215027 TaxID=3422596 RepID=UPI003D31BFBF
MPKKIPKHIIKLCQRIDFLTECKFSEDDIKLFLIEIRAELYDEYFLREICDFVAHPERDKGICHRRVDSRYAKQKFMKEGSEKVKDSVANNPNKPWNFFSDQILSYIKVEEIDKKLFEIIIIEGIEEISEETFLQYYKMTKREVQNLVKSSYSKKNGKFILKPYIKDNKKEKIDDLLKFIRGTITGKPAFTQTEIEGELIRAINRIQNKYLFKKIGFNEHTLNEIILCILCILHNIIFELFDNTKGDSYLHFQKNEEFPEKSTLSLMAETSNFHFPIISTKLLLTDYIEKPEKIIEEGNLNDLVNAVRDLDGNLKLKEQSA